ncbi:MAG: hypothetical protein Q8K05_00190 [Polaromonas sp.]|uniref:hypothetical protein n=1 Tax=Polaromonas sp. TaxID=1869339 RepID=UPI0027320B49|nr:hypothetical protein [Polaromonas sp.]MDP2254470.1 hypothetical protein [Polaromonas sp.]
MHKHAGLDGIHPAATARGHKANVSKILTSAPTHDSDLKQYADKKFTNKNQHSQTAIALAFDVSSSTVSRVVMGYGKDI